MALRPERATVRRNGREVWVSLEALHPTEQFAAWLEGPYAVVALFSASVVYMFMHYLVGLPSPDAWYRAMTFLVVARPCAVVISNPAPCSRRWRRGP